MRSWLIIFNLTASRLSITRWSLRRWFILIILSRTSPRLWNGAVNVMLYCDFQCGTLHGLHAISRVSGWWLTWSWLASERLSSDWWQCQWCWTWIDDDELIDKIYSSYICLSSQSWTGLNLNLLEYNSKIYLSKYLSHRTITSSFKRAINVGKLPDCATSILRFWCPQEIFWQM